MNPELLYLLICIALCFTCVLAYHWGKDRGAAAERIRLTGSSLPRFENPPPPPKKEGVPDMPNHPPMPDEEALLKAKAKEAIKKALEGITPEQDEDKACMDLYGAPPRLIVLMRRPGENPYRTSCPPAVTQDQLIDALMDMRLENFLCAHTIPAHAGTDLYYFSRKETAEYLLDMYHITPKAKH